jgi:hypothetical protein
MKESHPILASPVSQPQECAVLAKKWKKENEKQLAQEHF